MDLYNIAEKTRQFLKATWGLYKRYRSNSYARRAEKLIPYYEDAESVEWLRARESYSKNMDRCIFVKTEKKLGNHEVYRIEEFDAWGGVVIVYKDKQDPIFRYTKLVFEMSNVRKKCRFISEAEYDSSFQSVLEEGEVLFPAMGMEYMNGFAFSARKKGDWNALVIPRYQILVAMKGWQYFDMFEPVENEIVVDAGSFDGQTESEIRKWGGEKIKKIYAFESDPENCKKCRAYFRENGLEDIVQFVEKGTWDKQEAVWIKATGTSGSSVRGKGDVQAELTTIDSEVGSDKVTFIKMDIEGAELNALKGAKQTIMKNKPRLAICIYHKQEDIYKIPEYLLSLVPEYRFWIRHYCSNQWETVLYAKCL